MMKRFLSPKIILLFCIFSLILLGILFTYVHKTFATIETAHDWLGVYVWDDSVSQNTLPVTEGTSWLYLNCTQTPTSQVSTPRICPNFILPTTPGMYEFRLNPNQHVCCTNAPLPQKIFSEPFWILPTVYADSKCSEYNNVHLYWSPMKGVDPTARPLTDYYEIYRNGNKIGTSTGASYTDLTISTNTTYSYYIKIYNAKDPSPNGAQSGAISVLACPIQAWFQTSTGDVHSNTQVNAPGGP